MQTLYLKIGDFKIAYCEANAEAGKTIFFVHGNSVNKSSWKKQLSSSMLSAYRLVAFDLPGCGESARSTQPEKDYTIKGLANVGAKIINALVDGKPYVIAGLSLGTNILAEMLNDIEPAGIVMVGSSIVGNNIRLDKIAKTGTHVDVVFREDGLNDEVNAYANEVMFHPSADEVNDFINSYFVTDKKLRSTLASCISNNDFSDEINIIKNKNIKSLFVFGKDEVVVNTNYLINANLPLWNNKIYMVDKARHLVNIDSPDSFNELLAEYATAMFK